MRFTLSFAWRVAPTAAIIALLHPAHATAQPKYVAATQETILSSIEERQDTPPTHLIYVENRSTVPVTVFSTSLTGCENVKQQCYPQRANRHIAPGQREMLVRVEPKLPSQGFTYRFNFGWRADSSSIAAVAVLANAGDVRSREQLAARQRADSADRAQVGVRYNELTRDDLVAIGSRVAAMRAVPDSLVLAPGERTSMERIRIVLVDSQGTVLGRTRWISWQAPGSRAVQFTPPDALVARGTGRALFRFRLADEAQQLVTHPLPELEYPIVAAYPLDPHAPSVGGVATDADLNTPLACASVALEDSAQNVVAHERTDRTGNFILNAPRPGTYRVRIDAPGWSPVYGATEVAAADAFLQHRYNVRFTEPLLVSRIPDASDDFDHAAPTAVVGAATGPAPRPAPGKAVAAPAAAPRINGVTLGGSGAAPVLGIVGSAPAGTTFVQFVVDSSGRVDPASVALPAATDAATAASIQIVLPRMRFSPARRAGTPTCELFRMQVNVNTR